MGDPQQDLSPIVDKSFVDDRAKREHSEHLDTLSARDRFVCDINTEYWGSVS